MSARPAIQAIGRVALPLAMLAMVLAVIALAVGEHADIIERALPGAGSGPGQLGPVRDVIHAIQVPANVTFAALVPLGIIAGGGLMALGHRQGMKTMGTSAAAGFLVLLANGLAA